MHNPEQLYRKVGRRYAPLPELEQAWREGRPAEGIWLVENRPGRRSLRLICLKDELPDPLPLARMERWHDVACRAVLEAYERGKVSPTHRVYPSAVEVVTRIFRAIAREEAKRGAG